MGRVFDTIDSALADWIRAQQVFFVATAPSGDAGHINCSPRGLAESFAVAGPCTLVWADLTGSGAETIAHLRQNGRIVVMFCAFEGRARIVRVHGRGRVHLPGSPGFGRYAPHLPAAGNVGTRAIIEVTTERISDSCGQGVPLLSFTGERDVLRDWGARRGAAGTAAYQARSNAVSLDGLPALDIAD